MVPEPIANVAGSVLLNLFMDGSGKCKLPSTPPSPGLSRIQHLNMVIVNLKPKIKRGEIRIPRHNWKRTRNELTWTEIFLKSSLEMKG